MKPCNMQSDLLTNLPGKYYTVYKMIAYNKKIINYRLF